MATTAVQRQQKAKSVKAAGVAEPTALPAIAREAATEGSRESGRTGLITGIGFVRVFACRRWLGSLPGIVTAHYPGDLIDVVVFGSEDVPWETYKLARVALLPLTEDGELPYDPSDVHANGGDPWAVPPTSVTATRVFSLSPALRAAPAPAPPADYVTLGNAGSYLPAAPPPVEVEPRRE